MKEGRHGEDNKGAEGRIESRGEVCMSVVRYGMFLFLSTNCWERGTMSGRERGSKKKVKKKNSKSHKGMLIIGLGRD